MDFGLQVCSHVPDRHGEHAQRCPAISKVWRHNGIRDQLAAYAQSAHLHCAVEQRLPWHRTDGDARALKAADLAFETTAGMRIWGDVRVCSAPRDSPMGMLLASQERQKVAEYGQADIPSRLGDLMKVTPLVFETGGALSRCTVQLIQWLEQRKALTLHAAGWPWAVAMGKAREQMRQPLSTWLLKQQHRIWGISMRHKAAKESGPLSKVS